MADFCMEFVRASECDMVEFRVADASAVCSAASICKLPSIYKSIVTAFMDFYRHPTVSHC